MGMGMNFIDGVGTGKFLWDGVGMGLISTTISLFSKYLCRGHAFNRTSVRAL